jgi:esterase
MKNIIFKVFSILLILGGAVQAHAEKTVQEQLWQGQLALDPTPLRPDQINYEIVGDEGKPWMILIHGLGGSRLSWRNVTRELSKDYRVLVYDQRGHGESQIEGENFSSMTMAQDLKILMDALKIDRAHIVGHSMGARTAMRFAATYPERVVSVTVEDMHMMGRSKLQPDYIQLTRSIRPLYRPSFASEDEFYEIYQPYMRWETPEAARNFGHSGFPDGRFYLDFKPQVNLLYYTQALQEDMTAALRAVRAPLLFLAADQDPVLFGKGIEHIQTNRPDAEIITVPGSSHTIHASARSAFLSELDRFSRAASCQSLF